MKGPEARRTAHLAQVAALREEISEARASRPPLPPDAARALAKGALGPHNAELQQRLAEVGVDRGVARRRPELADLVRCADEELIDRIRDLTAGGEGTPDALPGELSDVASLPAFAADRQE